MIMKELSIAEKATRYDKAIKRVEDIKTGKCPKPFMFTEGLFDYIFPELKESEDEKIRKELICFLETEIPHCNARDKYIAWVEKQREKKSIWHNEDEEPRRGSLILLIMQSGTPIVAQIIEPNHIFNHGERWAYIDDLLEKQREQKPQGKTALEAINEEKVDNANKVDSRQEELTEFEKAVKQVMEEAIECGDTHNLKADAEMLLSLVHNSSWSEEDEYCRHQLIVFCENCMVQDAGAKRCANWLKSLKNRVQPQLKQEWSEEEIENCAREAEDNSCIILAKHIRQLKSLRPQSTWKPSDKQMRTLEHYMHTLVCNEHKEILFGLYTDLKKLKG